MKKKLALLLGFFLLHPLFNFFLAGHAAAEDGERHEGGSQSESDREWRFHITFLPWLWRLLAHLHFRIRRSRHRPCSDRS